ncbi:MAG TPA: biopolymer transporter ExbD [Atribacter sp.]|jgi:biopolymer transport protein ExbD|uniref:Biopolymer transport protein ExbD n=1 Tax=Candidatus Atribacter allofermentans TaxID=1852833 RepID=A0A1V5SIR4_9BACT|nr:biopolymer transporter ExbD [Atribacter sp.]MDD3713496.1 biopolymer transporter ExbD [Atribacterota bacterium]OQA54143.1 MAG: Biopolymer transport protein ExbD [Candidatus Atribacteria bacterium ADurb.Bin276]HHT09437.1 biopolymer transporter ExbD [Candidatus Atribacteria bacterium]MDI9593719.1 biopolymer transporter ExbD [Atribacterota bacterium]HOT04895.1 biopolymer transporter ExbD [Atribacter sp.]
MFRFRQKKPRRQPEINLTPMIDVVLQLIIFFIVTTTFISIESGAKVNLPSADFSKIEEVKTITVTITENNMLYVNGALVDANELPSAVVVALRNEPEATVIVEADKQVLHGKVVSVMDILKKAGAEKIAIATQPTKEE